MNIDMNLDMYDDMYEEMIEYANRIKSSEIYIVYLEKKEVLEKDPEIMEQINSFREKSFNIQVGHEYGYLDAYERLHELENEYNGTLKKADVKEFLEAEVKLSKFISKIMHGFTKTLAFDLSFIGSR